MIPKNIYSPIVASIISILAITDFMSIVFDNYFLRNHIDQNFTKYILLFFIPIFEVGYTKKFAVEILGWIASAVIFMSLIFNITHWFQTQLHSIITSISSIILLIIFIKIHIEYKKIRYLHLLFQLFFFIRISIISSKPNETLWWIDQVICFSILITSIVYFRMYIKKLSIER